MSPAALRHRRSLLLFSLPSQRRFSQKAGHVGLVKRESSSRAAMLLVPPAHVTASVSTPLAATNVDPARTQFQVLSLPAVTVALPVRSVAVPPVTSKNLSPQKANTFSTPARTT